MHSCGWPWRAAQGCVCRHCGIVGFFTKTQLRRAMSAGDNTGFGGGPLGGALKGRGCGIALYGTWSGCGKSTRSDLGKLSLIHI